MPTRSRVGRKQAAAFKAFVPGVSAPTNAEQREVNARSLAVTPRDIELDSDISELFRKPDITHVLSESEIAALDALIEKHGVAHLLDAIAQLCDSRVDESLLHNGRVIHHLAREDDFAYTAERLSNLVADARIKRA